MPDRADAAEAGATQCRRPDSAARAEPATPPGPPGPAVRWVTITREYDADDRLICERTTDVRETPLDHPAPPAPGHYL